MSDDDAPHYHWYTAINGFDLHVIKKAKRDWTMLIEAFSARVRRCKALWTKAKTPGTMGDIWKADEAVYYIEGDVVLKARVKTSFGDWRRRLFVAGPTKSSSVRYITHGRQPRPPKMQGHRRTETRRNRPMSRPLEAGIPNLTQARPSKSVQCPPKAWRARPIRTHGKSRSGSQVSRRRPQNVHSVCRPC